MRRFLTYCLFIFTTSIALAQPAGWALNTSSVSKKIIVQSKNFITIDGITNTVKKNDYVGIFSLVGGVEKCVGYTNIANDSATSFQFTIYGKTYTNDTAGYTENATYRIRWWNSLTKCQTVLANSDTLAKLDSLSTQLFITSATGSSPRVSYSGRNFTIGGKSVSPSISLAPPDLVFSSSKGLTIGSSTGTINLTNSVSGDYTIQLTSQYCIQQDTFMVRISEKKPLGPDLNKLTYSLLNPGCKSFGSIYFKTDSLVGQKPFTFKLINISTNEEMDNTSGQFDNLREGIYRLTVTDTAGTSSNYLKNISLLKTEECDNAILAPNAKDGLQAIFIPEVGNAKIIDRLGNTVKQISIPAEWDGRDSNGQFVPMGDYYLFINDQQAKVITVIR